MTAFNYRGHQVNLTNGLQCVRLNNDSIWTIDQITSDTIRLSCPNLNVYNTGPSYQDINAPTLLLEFDPLINGQRHANWNALIIDNRDIEIEEIRKLIIDASARLLELQRY